ncbi:MAG TPA: acyl-CoA dehydrogenase family protein [Amycolatopsis sp.]|uniref:acyl-CoA dehydrogenase family protein n=1 Tax=Amycolatopsis sp. TaxID=37632 RepID=UPI002B460A3E|nr:acyl-CoA dehydrogenase family protein [Amycolatopsis sp.]HKS45829.1 acyl-CoA dehydrogenase family protein [Amycolatopsis sp.]
MSLLPTPEQEMLRDTVREVVAERSPLAAVRQVIAGPGDYDDQVWLLLSRELGLAGLAVPEPLGGSGGGAGELVAVFTELGAGLVPSPLLACTLAATALQVVPGESATVRALAAGELIASVALTEQPEAGADWIPPAPATTVSRRDGRARLSGRKTIVLNGTAAGVLLVLAHEDGRNVLCLIDGADPGVRAVALPPTDLSRSLAQVDFADVPARVLDADVPAVLGRIRDVANLVLAAEGCGALAACVAMVSDHAKARTAFGRPIGAFQAVKHRAADMYTSWELAHAALREAVRLADDETRFGLAAATARALVSPAYLRAAGDTIQLHGGIGYTWEHDAHLYYRHAMSSHALCGDPDFQLSLIATSAGI